MTCTEVKNRMPLFSSQASSECPPAKIPTNNCFQISSLQKMGAAGDLAGGVEKVVPGMDQVGGPFVWR